MVSAKPTLPDNVLNEDRVDPWSPEANRGSVWLWGSSFPEPKKMKTGKKKWGMFLFDC